MTFALYAIPFFLMAAQASSSGGARITGRVTDAASGTPINGARVTLMMVVDVPEGTFGRQRRQSITDANGVFAFDSVAPAQYQLSVEKSGFASYPDVFGDAPIQRLTVASDSKDPQLRIALKKGAVLAGRILNATGEGEPNLQVSALKRTDKAGPLGFAQTGQAQTNDLGEFRIFGLPSGDYVIQAAAYRHDPFGPVQTGTTTLAPTFFPGALDKNAARVVTLAAGQAITDVEFTIATVAAFRVSGVVVDQAGRPSPHATVTLIPDLRTSGSFLPMMIVAADDGTFEIGEVLPGQYRVRANASEAQGAGGISSGFFAFAESDEVTPSDPGVITVDDADISGLRVVAGRR